MSIESQGGGGTPQEPKQSKIISPQVPPEPSIQDDKQNTLTLSEATRRVAGTYSEQVANIGYVQPSRLASLQGMRGELLTSSKTDKQLSDEKILWAFDFNETLMDTQNLEQSIHKEIAKILHKSPREENPITLPNET